MNSLELNQTITAKVFSFPHGSVIAEPKIKTDDSRFNGPLSADMFKRVQNLKSSYKDNFDWTVYDQIYNRFGEDQPRGGVICKTNFRLANHHKSCSKCHYSFEIDTYGRGCIHNCTYCYAKDQLIERGYWNSPMPFPIDLSDIRKIMHTVFETDKSSKWRSILESKIPLRIGSMSDSFMWMDKKYGITKELLRILKFYKYPHIVFTRSDLIAEPEYLEILDRSLCAIQFSITGTNEELTRKMEPGAPSLAKRWKALKTLSENGFWTTVRLNPIFPTFPDGYFSDRQKLITRFGSEESIPKFDLLDISNLETLFEQLTDSNVKSVLAGFVRLTPKAIFNLKAATGVNLKDFFSPESVTRVGEMHYSDAEIRHYYQLLKKESVKHNVRFSTCYIGNGIKDFYQYQELWTNKVDCCDAKSNVSGITKSAQEIPWNDRIKHSLFKDVATQAKSDEAAADLQWRNNGKNQIRHSLLELNNSDGPQI